MKQKRIGLSAFFRPTPFKIGCLIIFTAIWIFLSPDKGKPELIASLDNQITDTMFRMRGTVRPQGDVVIIDIDEKSLRELGQWPWPRNIIAGIVEKIHGDSPKALGFDIVFAEKDRTSPSEIFSSLIKNRPDKEKIASFFQTDIDYDQLLGEAVLKGPTVLGYVFQLKNDGFKNEIEVPFPSINIRISPDRLTYKDITLPSAYRAVVNTENVAQAETEGFFNVFPDDTGIVRKVPLFMKMDGIPYPSLALEMFRLGTKTATASLHISKRANASLKNIFAISIGEKVIRTDNYGQMTINYRGPVNTFPYVSAVDVLNGKAQISLKNKYVVFGTSAAGLKDLRATPFSNVFPGIEIQATVIDNMLKGDYFVYDIYTERVITIITICVLGLLLTLILSYFRPLTGGLLAILCFLVMISGNYYFIFLNHQIVGLSYPILTIFSLFSIMTLFNYFFEGREKQFIHKAFGHYVSPHVISQLMKSPEKLSLAGDQKEVSIFFSDIRDFTTISEQMNSKELGKLLNEYLTAMSDIIMDHNGLVDKYIGDAIMAIWGAPHEDFHHAGHALTASLEMLDTLKNLQAEWQQRHLPHIDIGIGINTGIVSVGNFGSARRFDYTVIGDNVNLASRLEGLNKMYGTKILISQYTKDALGEAFFCRKIDMVRVKGKKNAVSIYEPIQKGAPEPEIEKEVLSFEKGLAQYFNRNFTSAYEIISTLNRNTPQKLYTMYLERIQTYLDTPPPPDWDGAFIFRRK